MSTIIIIIIEIITVHVSANDTNCKRIYFVNIYINNGGSGSSGGDSIGDSGSSGGDGIGDRGSGGGDSI